MQKLPFVLLALLCSCSSGSTNATGAAPATSEPPVATEPVPSPDGGSIAAATPEDAIASRLFAWLEGKFDSSEQAQADETYFAISLTTCRVELPALGARVLYIEQAKVGVAPYRQRLYVVEGIDAATARSRVFEANDPSPLVGLCAATARPALAAADFVERVGCSVEMHWTGSRFEGHTSDARWTGSGFEADPAGVRCPSSLNGASFATTETTLERDRLRSWDRGFDAKNEQVWGATKGGYEFKRRTPAPDL
jgi:hypothetical protein